MMSSLLGYYMYAMQDYMQREAEMCVEFERRAEEARKAYWDACDLPRKQKKLARRKAVADYNFYKMLAQPMHFTF